MAFTQMAASWVGRQDDSERPDTSWRWHHAVTLSTQGGRDTAPVGLLGFCSDAGVRRNQGRAGAAEGPTHLRRALANVAWYADQQSAVDFGDVVVSDDDLEAGQEALAARIAEMMPGTDRMLVMGGGHETAYGSYLGLRRVLGGGSVIGIINLDAHFDLRNPGSRGPSSGTPFFQIATLSDEPGFRYACLGVAQESNTQSLFRRADEWGVTYRFDQDMQSGLSDDIRSVVDTVASQADALYLTIDLDVLPHYQAPGVSAPAARGVPLAVLEAAVDHVKAASRQCRYGMPLADIVELNPACDHQGMTARTAAVLANRVLIG